MFSRSFKRVGLHYTAFRNAIREGSRQTAPLRGVSPRKKFAVKANVESRVKGNPNAKILILTSFTTSTEIKTALDAGVLSAVVKDCSSRTLIDALRRTAQGEKIISQDIIETISEKQHAPILSSRQLEILQLVSKGFNNEEIAKQIGISRGGVKAHLSIIFDRLGVFSRTEAASIAVSSGII